VDEFGFDNGLLTPINELGKHLTAIGPMLLNAKSIPCNVMDSTTAPIYMISPTTMTVPDGRHYEREIPIIDIGLLADNDDPDVHYMIVYNNRTEEASTEDFHFTSEFIAGRDMFDLYEPRNTGNPTVASVTLQPGEGRIYMIAPGNYYATVQEKILAKRLAHEKAMLQYDMYFAHLAGLVPLELIGRFQAATTSAEIGATRKALNDAIGTDPIYVQMRDNLDLCRDTLSELSTDQRTDLGPVYSIARNLFSRGVFHQNSSTEELTNRFHDEFAVPVCQNKQAADQEDLATLIRDLGSLMENPTPEYLDPTTMLQTPTPSL
jgi:hypothetical protein